MGCPNDFLSMEYFTAQSKLAAAIPRAWRKNHSQARGSAFKKSASKLKSQEARVMFLFLRLRTKRYCNTMTDRLNVAEFCYYNRLFIMLYQTLTRLVQV